MTRGLLARITAAGWRRRTPTVLQSEAQDCAHACLVMVARAHGSKLTLMGLRERFTPSTRGTSISRLIAMADAVGFQARAYRAEPGHVGQLKLPCILHWDAVHFVVLDRCDGVRFELVDPGAGRFTTDLAEFSRRFTGIAVELVPRAGISGRDAPSGQGSLAMLKGGLRGTAGTIASIVTLALLLELVGLASPLLIQIVTDSIIVSSDSRLLLLLTIAFAVAAVVHTVLSIARSSLLIRLGETLSVGWNSAVCERLLKLPYVFFVRRSIGDIHSRFASIYAIQRTVTNRFVEGALDGITAVLSLAMIVFYSPMLASITLAASVLYGAFRVATFPRVKAAEEQSISVQAVQQSLLLEILHGIHSIKANGFEAQKLSRFSARTEDAARSSASVQRWSGLVNEGGELIGRLHRVAAIGAGATLAIRGDISAGMLVAYLTYATQFSERSSRLVDLVSEWNMLVVHGDRLADIMLAPPEAARGSELVDPGRCDLRIEGLRFRYNEEEPWVLDGVGLHVAAGECIAIKGVSGSGKSTLAKLVIGLLEPGAGSVQIGGKAISSIPRAEMQQHVACVLQDDQLFNGSIAENIAFFVPNYCRQRVAAAAKAAQMHDEIMVMPVGYETKLIDMGASLSGGQRQRLILARALYRDPKILILDEASSHLDIANERLVNDAISRLSITRIIIAHRPETLAIADRVVELRNGVLVDPVACAATAGAAGSLTAVS